MIKLTVNGQNPAPVGNYWQLRNTKTMGLQWDVYHCLPSSAILTSNWATKGASRMLQLCLPAARLTFIEVGEVEIHPEMCDFLVKPKTK